MIRKGRVLLLAPLAIFGAAGGLLYWRFLQPGEGPFHENLLPELIGFCFEGFVLIGLLSLVQAVRESEQRKQLWLSQRASLRDILSHLDLALLQPEAEPVDTNALEQNPKLVKQLLNRLGEHELELDALVKLKQLGSNSAPLARDLLGVAAQLSTDHIRAWVSITESLTRVANAEQRTDIERALMDLLTGLIRFDELPR